MMKASLLFFSGIMLSGSLCADPVKSQAPKATATKQVAGYIVQNEQTPRREGLVFLTVDKSTLRADLKSLDANSDQVQHLMSFRIAIGKEEGDKRFEGDNKTPEGIYFAERILDGAQLPAKYGPKAIPINFPNPIDRASGKTGHGIWLHGVEADTRVEAAKVTEGCVAFYNADIETLTRWLRPQQGIVIIGKNADVINRLDDVRDIKTATEEWAKAWGERKLDSYVGYYGPKFRFNGMSLAQYRNYKDRVFKGYKVMNVAMTNVQVFSQGSYGVSIMNQDFTGDQRFAAHGRKIMYWEKDAKGKWQISHEVFENRRFDLLPYDSHELGQMIKNSPSSKVFEANAATPL